MQNLAPIALFVYNRPEHTRRTLKFLRENRLAAESRLFIFSDGAKSSKDEDKVEAVRELLRSVDGFASVEIIERKNNRGLADSIIEGVTKLVNEYGKVIVFEDDLISSPYTLQYFNDALRRYETQDKVMHIGAYMYPMENQGLPEAFFARIATSWGWATWRSSWSEFEPDISKLMTRFDRKKINDFSIDGTMNFWKQMEEFQAGKNNSWAIRWYASIFLKGGLSLNPSRSLINNIGHDGSGIHSGVNDIYSVTVRKSPIKEFPQEVKEDPEAYLAIKRFLSRRKGNLVQRALRFIKGKLVKIT